MSDDDRESLEREARRLGVERPERYSRDELLARARSAARKGVSALRLAGSLASSVVRGVVDAASDVAARRRGASPEPRPPAPRPAATPPASPPGAPRSAAPTPSTERTPPGAKEPPPSTEVQAPPAAGEAPPPRAKEPSGSSEVQAPPPAEQGPAADEPIRTKTLARLLAQQGHRGRAIAMYEALAQVAPEDDEIRTELEELRLRDGEGSAEAEMVSVAVDDRSVWVSWQVSPEGIARASRLLGAPGRLAVRLAVTVPDATRIVRTDTRELADVDPSGEWVVRDLPEGARATAAVGLLEHDRFVSIAHHRAR